MRGTEYSARLEARRRGWRRLKLSVFSFLLAALLAGGMYWLKTGELFRIQRVSVEGLDPQDRNALLELLKKAIRTNPVRNFLGAEHYFAWPSNVELPVSALAHVNIEKRFWERAIVIRAERRKPYGVWCGEQSAAAESTASDAENHASEGVPPACFWFDETEGILFEEAPETMGQLIPKLHERIMLPPQPGKPLFDARRFSYVKAIIEFLNTERIPVREFTVERLYDELWADAVANTRIMFSLREAPEHSALPALRTFLKTHSLHSISSIDLTVPNKLFHKSR